ncbi:MAG: phosphotransferase-like protein [Allorhizobium sp.]
MSDALNRGQIVILNGVPRSGKASIAKAIQNRFPGLWMNLDLDTADRFLPGIGLHQGGKRPDLQNMLSLFLAARWESIALYSRLGLNVVADLGLDGGYPRAPGLISDCARRMAGFPVLFVRVLCSLEAVRRREQGEPGRKGLHLRTDDEHAASSQSGRYDREVQRPRLFDMTVNTDVLTSLECADAILERLDRGIPRPTALERAAALD